MLPYLFLALFSVIKPASQAYSWPLSSFYEKENKSEPVNKDGREVLHENRDEANNPWLGGRCW